MEQKNVIGIALFALVDAGIVDPQPALQRSAARVELHQRDAAARRGRTVH